jgi:probable F420-dependent oxidoreductase
MKFGIHLQVPAKRQIEVVTAAETYGFESIWLPDHLILPLAISARVESANAAEQALSAATPVWDPWVQMAWLASHTSTIRFGVNVFNIGLRHPVITARALTTADMATSGRVEFGIGASWLPEEWDVMGLPFSTRGRRVDESIGIVRRLLTEEVVEHKGEFFRFPPVGFMPKPVQSAIRFHIGGDSKAAIRRAAALGDGWIPPAQPDIATLAHKLADLRQARTEAGRSGPFEVTVCASRIESADEVRRYEDVGVDRLVVVPYTRSRDGVEMLQRFGNEIISKLLGGGSQG